MRELFQPENKEDRINRAARYMGYQTPVTDEDTIALVEALLSAAEEAAMREFMLEMNRLFHR